MGKTTTDMHEVADQETARVQVWRHPDPLNYSLRITYGEDAGLFYETVTGTAEVTLVLGIPHGWTRLAPVLDPE